MRARNIKPGFFLNCELSEVDFASRLLFIGLWCYADREGRFEWKPKQIKGTIFPYDEVDIENLLCNLMSLHFITRNDTTGYIPHFKEHQHPHPNEAKSRLPENPNKNNDIAFHANGTPFQADIMIKDTMIEDTIIPLSKMTISQFRDLFLKQVGMIIGGGVNNEIQSITQNHTPEAIEFAILSTSTRQPKPTNPFMYFKKVLEGQNLQTSNTSEAYDPSKEYPPDSFYYALQQSEKGASNAA